MPATKGAARAGQPGPAARPRTWPAVLAWALLGLQLLLLASVLWLDQLIRDAGRPDITVLAPFAIPPSVAALTAGVVGRWWPAAAPGTPSAGCCWPRGWSCGPAPPPSATCPTA